VLVRIHAPSPLVGSRCRMRGLGSVDLKLAAFNFHLSTARLRLKPSRMANNRNPKFDAYIEEASPFAQPILRHLRTLVHEACPEATEEIKWSNPCFGYH